MRYAIAILAAITLLAGCQNASNVQVAAKAPDVQVQEPPTSPRLIRLRRVQQLERIEPLADPVPGAATVAAAPSERAIPALGAPLSAPPSRATTAMTPNPTKPSPLRTQLLPAPSADAVSPPAPARQAIVSHRVTARPPARPAAVAATSIAATPRTPAPAASPAPAGPARPCLTRYTIAPHDTLWSLSQQYLGDPKRWPEIAAANPGLDPNHMSVGRVITVPLR